MMQKAVLLIKAAVVGLLFLVLQIPLQMIDGLVAERAARQRAVVQEIAGSSFGKQAFAGPILSVPYVEEYERRITEEKKTRVEKYRVERVARFFPATGDVDGRATVETKSRGLFKACVFDWRAGVKGEFVLDGKFAWERSKPGSRISASKPFVSLALGDPRGLAATTALRWDGEPEAGWNVSALASGAQRQLLERIEGRKECAEGGCADRLEVRFIEPIDVYSLSDRALKYGFLFIALTFGAFGVFEVLKALRIHPAQCFLVGAALATFFLLLLGLSEHVAFRAAYAIASAACIALLGFYLSAVLRSPGRGVSFAAMLTGLYGALYGLLVSEDNSLLLGAILVFGLVALVLVLTRRLDWYALRTEAEPARA
jgi:inner membrane protein involved in colicin E2 resistance